MKRSRISAGLLAVSLLLFASNAAEAIILNSWGDFEIHTPSCFTPVDAWAFDSSHTNPSGFPVPSNILPARCYPSILLPGREHLTVGELQSYLSMQGLPDDNFALIWKNGDKPTTLYGMVLTIDSQIVAEADVLHDGSYTLPANTDRGFVVPTLNLNDFDSEDCIEICYVDGLRVNLKEVQFAATPEPVSLVLLGTGFVGLVISRARRRKQA